jgi:hypothetical protein
VRTLHLGLTLAALAAAALALGIHCLDWRALTGGSIASIFAFRLLLEDAYEPQPAQPITRLSPAYKARGRRALPSTRQPAS